MTLGPRARRRLLRAGIGAALIAAVVAAVLLTTSSTRRPGARAGAADVPSFHHTNGSISYGPNGDRRYNANSGNLTFGMTRKQVRHLVGPPARVAGSCWQYPVDKTIKAFGRTSTVEAERVCFSFGVFNTRYTQWQGGVWRDDAGAPVPDPTH